MKRFTAVFLAAFAGLALADNTQYNNEAGERDLTQPIAQNDQYHNEAGEHDFTPSIAANDEYNNEAGQTDEHQPTVG